MSDARQLAVVILAAGKGKRMGDPNRAKVLTELDGKPLLSYVLDQCAGLHPHSVTVVIGHQALAVRDFVQTMMPIAQCVVQQEQLGTGHAVLQTASVVGSGAHTDVLILSGDVPLARGATLQAAVDAHRADGRQCTVLTTTVDDPTGYGRVIVDAFGKIARIVEQKDAAESDLLVNTINSGIYIVAAKDLFSALQDVTNDNAQTEYYLTDIVHIFSRNGIAVMPHHVDDSTEVQGINTPADLGAARAVLVARELHA